MYRLHRGTDIYSASSGIVVLSSYDGANGYSLHISNGELTFIYGHISPNYLVSVRRYYITKSNYCTSRPKIHRRKAKWLHNRSTSTLWHKKRWHSRQSLRLYLITYRLQNLPSLVLSYCYNLGNQFQ